MMPEPFTPYTLMRRNILVAKLILDAASGAILSISAVWESAHVLADIPVRKQTIDRGALNECWRGRAISASRSGIRDALTELHVLWEGEGKDFSLLPRFLRLTLTDA
ncbi:MAG: hypothetical protein K2P87_05260 [Lachnospiraceae bacterium]|nr:hypothetical protein [Lachnospiraceae bacterium]